MSMDCLQPVCILWDIENCSVPHGVSAEDVAVHIRTALRVRLAMRGPITLFSAYGDSTSLSPFIRQGCQKTGISLIDVPRGTKDAADKAILVDMFLFALDNPPPCAILLISGDVDFAPALHKLGQRGYHVILAIPANRHVSPALCNACQFLWDWPSVACGKALVHSVAVANLHSARPSKDEKPSKTVVTRNRRHLMDRREGNHNLVGPRCDKDLNAHKHILDIPVGIYEELIKMPEECMEVPVIDHSKILKEPEYWAAGHMGQERVQEGPREWAFPFTVEQDQHCVALSFQEDRQGCASRSQNTASKSKAKASKRIKPKPIAMKKKKWVWVPVEDARKAARAAAEAARLAAAAPAPVIDHSNILKEPVSH